MRATISKCSGVNVIVAICVFPFRGLLWWQFLGGSANRLVLVFGDSVAVVFD